MFFSYSHNDDEILDGFITPLSRSLSYFLEIKSGQSVHVFVDSVSILWGDEWRTKIEAALSRCSVFVPFVTPNYLRSISCRDEFTAFNSAATHLGACELILPVLPVKTPVISRRSDDDIVQILERRQYKEIEEAILAGPSSREWRTMAASLAMHLLQSIEAAEPVLPAVLPKDLHEAEGHDSESGTLPPDERDSDSQDLFDLYKRSEEAASSVQHVGEDFLHSLMEFSEKLGKTPDLSGSNANRQQILVIHYAAELRDPATGIEQSGKAFKDAVVEMDSVLRGTVDLIRDAAQPKMLADMESEIQQLNETLAPLSDLVDQVDETLAAIRPIEVLSKAMRTALRPGRAGMTAFRDAIRVTQSWRQLRKGPSQADQS